MSALQQKSMDRWRDLGFVVASVERRKRFPARGKPRCRLCKSQQMVDIAVDLFNCFDLIAVGKHVALIQVTDGSNHAKRRKKLIASAEAKICVSAGCVVVVESWLKNEKENRWKVRYEVIKLSDFPKDLPGTPEAFFEQMRREKLPAFPAGADIFTTVEAAGTYEIDL